MPLPSYSPDSGPEADRFLDLRDCLGGRRHIKMEVSSHDIERTKITDKHLFLLSLASILRFDQRQIGKTFT